jgi:hypothetical protein
MYGGEGYLLRRSNDRHIIFIREVGLNALGKLDIPHHEGAGGVKDFVDNELFQKHVTRVSSTQIKAKLASKRKR